MENELLNNESIASVKAMLDYVDDKIRFADAKTTDHWNWVASNLEQELESRIKRIFP